MPNEGLPEGLSSIQDQPEPKGSLSLYEGKRDSDLVDEEVDERILNLLGLEDVFDIDYATYKILLREKLAEGRISGKELPREEDELLVSEFRKVKSKVGRFKVKKKTISTNLTTGVKSPIIKSTKLLPASILSDKTTEPSSEIKSIEKLLDSILNTLKLDSKEEKKKAEAERKEAELRRRKSREANLEKGLEKAKSFISKITAPFQSIIDKIQRFLFFTILGRAFKLFMDWAGDPKNKKKLAVIGRFLKDWWPALLGAWFLFANPLGRFIKSIIGSVIKLTFQLAKFAIPRLISFAAANPLTAIAVTGAVAAGAGEMWRQKEEKSQVTRESEKRGVKPSVVQKELDTAKSSPLAMFGQGMSNIGGYNNGGTIFSGIVGENDGTKVNGAGKDTQFFPVEGGGGAVLAPNELVLTEDQQSQIEKDTGVHPATYVAGIQPKNISGNLTPMASGGVVGYNQGGVIGMQGGGWLHNMRKFLTRGTGNVMAPRGSNIGFQGQILGFNNPFSPRVSLPLEETYSENAVARYNRLRSQTGNRDYLTKDMFGRHFSYTPPNYAVPGLSQPQLMGNQRLRNAIQNARDITNIPGAGAYKPLVESTASSSIKMQTRYDQLREAMRQTGMKGADENMNLYGKPIKRQSGGLVPQGPFTPLPHSGYVRPQGSFIPKPMLHLPGPMPGSRLPFGYNPFQGLQRGGLVKENTGYNMPGATADRQYLPPMAVQPGEAHYIIPKDAVQRGAVPMVDYIVAKLDPNSNPKNKGKGLISPPSQTNFIPLPPSVIKSASSTPNRPSPGSSVVPEFPAYRKTTERYENMKLYTLLVSNLAK